ncbi:hypothetical protein ATANTOWER_012004 [Ataeniobius toweri]|uniref:Uncharacterized protein n=1 Tax=Ataeniobius toweri TaxID=208326 RepID=A0ABU7A5U2_9TELE|nr:hypothetical protein [Ataeniobius toweri]
MISSCWDTPASHNLQGGGERGTHTPTSCEPMWIRHIFQHIIYVLICFDFLVFVDDWFQSASGAQFDVKNLTRKYFLRKMWRCSIPIFPNCFANHIITQVVTF